MYVHIYLPFIKPCLFALRIEFFNIGTIYVHSFILFCCCANNSFFFILNSIVKLTTSICKVVENQDKSWILCVLLAYGLI